ncbi:DUF5028 domain-containing protein [Ruminococcus flavefaciens]|uniref:DUF5028 domain-containing protein n=1 Tax=Ruminococcus flavefaciens TaxID=1265 RepID=UPI0026F0BC12|nr:DUF5028 domain-containing protein [Ruminococcus flavefaciens]
MKYSKLLKAISVIAIITVYVARIYYVNSKPMYPMNEIYAKENEVEIGNDFFDSSKDKMNGYSVEVLDTELLRIDDFYNKYNVPQEERVDYNDYMYLVSVKFRNNTNEMRENAGIKLPNYLLVNNSFMTLSDIDLYKYVNRSSKLMFSLDKGTDADIILPFPISEEKISIRKFKKGNPQLIISLYPTRKAILL